LPDYKPKQKGKKKVVKGDVAIPKGSSTTQAGRYTTSRRNTPSTQASEAIAQENAQKVDTRLC
jgi:lipopolysaccharide export system protein LptA